MPYLVRLKEFFGSQEPSQDGRKPFYETALRIILIADFLFALKVWYRSIASRPDAL